MAAIVISSIIPQLPIARRLNGVQSLGMLAIYLFLAVIGAFCDLSALQGLGFWACCRWARWAPPWVLSWGSGWRGRCFPGCCHNPFPDDQNH